MKMRTIVQAFVLSVLVGMSALATGRSVSYTNGGSGGGGQDYWGDCRDEGYLDIPSTDYDCRGIYPGNISHVGNLRWCTYSLSEHNSFFTVTDVVGGAGMLTFRRNLRGKVSLQFNGHTGSASDFNVTFGFKDGFYRGDELSFDFNFDPDTDFVGGSILGVAGIVSTISIHLGEFDYPPEPESASGSTQDAGGSMSPYQAHKCQDPGSQRN